ncbi:N-acetylmannosamine kinase [Nonomuraea coxensis DSM 45129]|uniref:N-acetylmannosamine kinase n=1 Tax=Nonomuraea coxensis DSM 45129 TaxID=1122611 RepID=A0ABX8UB45_9ACTN|nr:ROK family protein [Nonomuraea coxensis]QYC45006.1 N-acetylmannosamine kinase [Nonomuraea coxensis DSM 45129]
MILAIDVGGTKMAAGLVSGDGTVVRAARAATPLGAPAEVLWRTLADLVAPFSAGPLEGVGVGCGGPMSWPDGEVSPLNIPGWRGFPLRARLAHHFPGLPVRLHNDAICLAVAEHWKGAGQGSADMLGMVVSTGVGGGLILNGRLVNGGTGNAGHIGHVVVEPDGGPRCECGGHGCLEAVARGPALTTWALTNGWHPRPPTPTAGPPTPTQGSSTPTHGSSSPAQGAATSTGGPTSPVQGADTSGEGAVPLAQGVAGFYADASEEGVRPAYREDRVVTARQLAADARAGDVAAVRAMRRAGRALGIAIASATHLCDLDVVTIGGGLSQAGEPLFGPLEEALREHARMGFARRVKVMPAALGQEAGLIGAAALLLAGESYWIPPTGA